jgi:hypothetical protein
MDLNFQLEGATSTLGLTRAHRNLADAHIDLHQAIDRTNQPRSTKMIGRALAELEHFSRGERLRLLQGGLSPTEGDTALMEWVAARYDHLFRIAYDVASIKMPTNEEHEPLAWATALLIGGHAVKWRKISMQRPDLGAREKLHTLYRLAVSKKCDAQIVNISVDSIAVETTVEAAYIRALLIERFAGGALSPRRLEILDNWLVASLSTFWLTRTPIAGEPVLGVDPNDPARSLTPDITGTASKRYLSFRPLSRQLQRIIDSFHRGIIFPGWGMGLSFRIEDHIAVIDFLEREIHLIGNAAAIKSKRLNATGGEVVTMFAGFNDIYAHALIMQNTTPPKSTTASIDQVKLAGYGAPTLEALVNANSDTGSFNITERIRGLVTLVDFSESGVGIEMSSEDAAILAIDHLVAIQISVNRPRLIGMVVRKVNLHQRAKTLVGVKILARVPLRATLEQVSDSLARPTIKGILVCDNAEHGFGDSIILNDVAFKSNPTLSLSMANELFHFRLGRVRQQGQGWKMVAVDVTVAR